MGAARSGTGIVKSRHLIGIAGRFERHLGHLGQALSGTTAGGRWGPPRTFPVLYLGRPRASVVAEAYRHLVDPFEGMTSAMVQPRRLVQVEVDVTKVLDLRDEVAHRSLGISHQHLTSPVGEYEPCWRLARAVHQIGAHGILAPSASGLGETLALYEDHLPEAEHPRLIREERWERLPADPRRLRVLSDEEIA
jgi:RES domain-containing protein